MTSFRDAMRLRGLWSFAVFAFVVTSREVSVHSFEGPLEPHEIRQLSLEELMAIDVTTVAGIPQDWFSTPTAMTVITAEDIRQSGHRSLAEVLRLVPGMFVGRQGSSFWRIGARGFTGTGIPSPRNLVLIDGRTVYDPLFGGVFWDVQDVVLQDIERIEVIRGPGATLWGPNAVNGVINIITKSAHATQGALLQVGGGTYEKAFGTLRYGTEIAPQMWLSIYGKAFARDEFDAPNGGLRDDWTMLRGGFRLDSRPDSVTEYTVQGALYYSPHLGAVRSFPVPNAHLQFETVEGEDEAQGGDILGRVTRQAGENASFSLQAYYDRTERSRLGGLVLNRSTVDIDMRNNFRWSSRQELVWGLGFRSTADDTEPGRDFVLRPESRSSRLFSSFVQNTSVVVPDRLYAMLGTKLTHFTYTDWEAQPSVRLWWTPDARQMLWGAISRPVRHPTRVELNGQFILAIVDPGLFAGGAPTGTFVSVGARGTDTVTSEHLVSYELGYRTRPSDRLTLDTTFYYNDYSHLISVDNPFGTFNNNGFGSSYVVEMAASGQVLPQWRLSAGYSFTEAHHEGPILTYEDRNAVRHMALLRSNAGLMRNVDLNVVGYFVGELPISAVEGYSRLDVGLTWRLRAGAELAIWGQNLLQPGVQEIFGDFPRGLYLEGMGRF